MDFYWQKAKQIHFSKIACVCIQSCLTLRPHGLQPTRLVGPWKFPGKNTGVGCRFHLQGFKNWLRNNSFSLLHSNLVFSHFLFLLLSHYSLFAYDIQSKLLNGNSIKSLSALTFCLKFKLWFFQQSCMDVRVGLQRKLSAQELMLLNCGVREDS